MAAEIVLRGKRGRCGGRRALPRAGAAPDLWLLFAPVKRARIDLHRREGDRTRRRAAAAGLTRHTVVERVNVERLRANAIEAAEQTRPPERARRSTRR